MRDSNPRMPGPEPGALPLGQSPKLHYFNTFYREGESVGVSETAIFSSAFSRRRFARNKKGSASS
jgi:hypothetical protein